MTRNSTTDPHDLASRAQALRTRIAGDDRKLAIAYPDQVADLEAGLAREREQLAELDEAIEAAKADARGAVAEAVDAYFAARGTLMKLNGYFYDPGFRHRAFVRTALTMSSQGPGSNGEIRGDFQATTDVRDALLSVAEMRPAPESTVSETQRIHEERLRNERAGRGYLTDAQIADVEKRGEAAWHGAGWRRMRREAVPEA
jgi:hypothetical protein